jgi:hypothetical protein
VFYELLVNWETWSDSLPFKRRRLPISANLIESKPGNSEISGTGGFSDIWNE